MAQKAVIDLLADVAQRCRNAPTRTLIGAYVRAARLFCSGSRWLTASIEGATVAGTQSYSLGSDTYAEIFGVAGITLYRSADDPVSLGQGDSSDWDPTEDQAEPEVYQYLPEAQVALHPTPDAAYDMTIAVWTTPKRGSTSIDDRLVTRWEYALQDGALAYLLGLTGVPWSDPQAALVHEAKFRAAITQAANIAALGANPAGSPLRVSTL